MGQVEGVHFLDDGGDETSLEVHYSLTGLGQALEIKLYNFRNQALKMNSIFLY